MGNTIQPLTADARHEAIRKIEFAASLTQSARWWVCSVFLLMLLPLRRLLLFVGLPAFAIVGGIAFAMSNPLEEAAADIRNRLTRPLIIMMALVGFFLACALGLDCFSVFAVICASQAVVDDDGAAYLLAGLAVLLTIATAWGLWAFIDAWKAVNALRAGKQQGFSVVTSGGADQSTVGTRSNQPAPPPFKIPPRPKR